MQLTLLSAAAAVSVIATAAATVTEKTAVQLNKECDHSRPYARIINRCDYDVHLWSVFRGIGCPTDGMVTLKKGETYSENYQKPKGGDVGVSIKVGKTTDCKAGDIVQLEYFLEERQGKEDFWGNYLDVSYVDCLNGDCPTRKEGYYLQSGNQTGVAKASAANTRCPILACSDAASCSKMSYVLPDDVQTKSCDLESSMDFYMCGSHPPTADDEKPASPASSQKADSSAPKPSSTLKAPSSAGYKVDVAAVTKAPEIKEPANPPKIKTKVVYVTAYEYVNAKRHEHAQAHARRHQPFHA
jgi:hypothetical protein